MGVFHCESKCKWPGFVCACCQQCCYTSSKQCLLLAVRGLSSRSQCAVCSMFGFGVRCRVKSSAKVPRGFASCLRLVVVLGTPGSGRLVLAVASVLVLLVFVTRPVRPGSGRRIRGPRCAAACACAMWMRRGLFSLGVGRGSFFSRRGEWPVECSVKAGDDTRIYERIPPSVRAHKKKVSAQNSSRIFWLRSWMDETIRRLSSGNVFAYGATSPETEMSQSAVVVRSAEAEEPAPEELGVESPPADDENPDTTDGLLWS